MEIFERIFLIKIAANFYRYFHLEILFTGFRVILCSKGKQHRIESRFNAVLFCELTSALQHHFKEANFA